MSLLTASVERIDKIRYHRLDIHRRTRAAQCRKAVPGAGVRGRNVNSCNTQYFKVQPDQETGVKKILSVVYEALSEKGYDPVNQIVGYIMSGDPTYITNYMGARSLIMKVERDELVEEIMNDYIEFNHWNKK